MKRVKGYVVGYDVKVGELVWTVKVKDSDSVHNKKKFEVASLHPGTMITKRGVDVTFRVQEFRVGRIEQEKELRAVGVSLGLNDPSDEGVDEPVDWMSFALVQEEKQTYAWYNECKTWDACEEWLYEKSSGCHLIGFVHLSVADFGEHGQYGWDDEAAKAFELLQKVIAMDGAQRVFEALVEETFKLVR